MMFINRYAIVTHIDGILDIKCFVDSDVLLDVVIKDSERGTELIVREATRREQSLQVERETVFS